MNEPKISIITPMYNCEKYIADCINSVRGQTFGDFEHIIVDDCSTDRSVARVMELLREPAASKIKTIFLRHGQNAGQWTAIDTAFKVASGKYIRVLHADDVFLPNALESLYRIAEQYDADVVHEPAKLISTLDGGETIKPGNNFKIDVHDRHPVNGLTIMSNDLNDRLADWFERGTHVDIMYNLIRRDFLIDGGICFNELECGGNFLFTFCWLMKAKTVVKVPQATYIYRAGNPTSITNTRLSADRIERAIDQMIECNRYIERFMSGIEFFADKKYLRELVKIEAASVNDGHSIRRHGFYNEDMTAELYETVERAFEKHFGADGWLAAYFFHIAHGRRSNRMLEEERLFREHTKARYLLYRTA